jgi:acetyl-CoA C-acetyltransferase
VPATTLNKMCGSGMKAAMIAWDRLALGQADVIVAGGMESMTNAPYLLPAMRGGARIGHQKTYDHMFLDGLEDAYDKGRLMGTFAEDCAEAFQFTRAQQDEYALTSLSNALAAIESGAFAAEVAPVTITSRKAETTHRRRRTAGQGATRKDPASQTRLPRRWHGDSGKLLVDLRWCRGPGPVPREAAEA